MVFEQPATKKQSTSKKRRCPSVEKWTCPVFRFQSPRVPPVWMVPRRLQVSAHGPQRRPRRLFREAHGQKQPQGLRRSTRRPLDLRLVLEEFLVGDSDYLREHPTKQKEDSWDMFVGDSDYYTPAHKHSCLLRLEDSNCLRIQTA